MTLNLKIKNTNTAAYAATVLRQGSVALRLQPGEEGEVSLWDDAPLTVLEEPAAAAPNVGPKPE